MIHLVTLVFLLANDEYRMGVPGAALWYVLGVACFVLWGRKSMVRSPEEAVAFQANREPS